MALVTETHIEPYGSRPYKSDSSKSIFRESTLYSSLIFSDEINNLSQVFENNTIITGLKVKSTELVNNERTIRVILEEGRVIQDRTIIDITEDIVVSIDVFSTYNIITTNNVDNYFTISGDQTDNFPENKVFGIFNATYSSFNHTNWVVEESIFDGTNTKVYTSQSITDDDNTGQIVNDNFPNSDDSIIGTILIASKYQYEETIDDNPIIFYPIYIDSQENIFPEFDINQFRIIYSVIKISKDLDNYIINPTALEFFDSTTSVYINGQSYEVQDITKTVLDNLDGGII